MTLDLEVNEVEVKVLTSLASVTWVTGSEHCHIGRAAKGILIYSLSSGSATNDTNREPTGTSSSPTSTSSTSDAQGNHLKSLAGIVAAALAFAYLL
jgi:hypothetical protein